MYAVSEKPTKKEALALFERRLMCWDCSVRLKLTALWRDRYDRVVRLGHCQFCGLMDYHLREIVAIWPPCIQ